MKEPNLESYVSDYKSTINDRIKQCDLAPPIISRPPSTNSIFNMFYIIA